MDPFLETLETGNRTSYTTGKLEWEGQRLQNDWLHNSSLQLIRIKLPGASLSQSPSEEQHFTQYINSNTLDAMLPPYWPLNVSYDQVLTKIAVNGRKLVCHVRNRREIGMFSPHPASFNEQGVSSMCISIEMPWSDGYRYCLTCIGRYRMARSIPYERHESHKCGKSRVRRLGMRIWCLIWWSPPIRAVNSNLTYITHYVNSWIPSTHTQKATTREQMVWYSAFTGH